MLSLVPGSHDLFNISSLVPRPIDPTIQNQILKAGNGPGNKAKHISSMSSWEHAGPGNETVLEVSAHHRAS